jgi:Flp pilus assembly protein TadD
MGKLFALALLSSLGLMAEDRWLRFSSEHFEVFSDAGAGTGREVLRRFEQIRHVFEAQTGRGNLTPLPVRVFVFRSGSEFQPYNVRPDAAGYYQSGFDRDYIAMKATGADTDRVVFHEYTHLLLRHAGYSVPAWFNEGLAELFSTADVGKTEVRVGDPVPAHVITLRGGERMLDLATLVAVDHESPYYNERGKSGIFYAQSWALLHMLNFAPEYQPGVAKFMQMILGGQDAIFAFRQAFGKSPVAVIQDLKAYLQGSRFDGARFKVSRFDAGKIPAEPVPSVGVELALADLLLAIGKPDDARLLYGRLEASHPDDNQVLLALGQYALRTEDYPGARRFFERAIQAGSKSPRLLFEYAMLLREAQEPETVVVQHLTRAVTLDNTFFEGHNFLGHLHLSAARYPEAIQHLKRAAELQPARASVWENLALAYHRSGNKPLARAAAKLGKKASNGPEEAARLDALIDLIETDADKIVIAPAPRKANPEVVAAPPSSRAEGMLTQVDCLGKQARVHVVTSHGKLFLLVRELGGPVMELQCGPMASRPVIVQYRPEAHRTYGTTGVVTGLEFR